MGADLIFSMCYVEVSEEEARRRVEELTFEKMSQKDERNDFLLGTHEAQLEDLVYLMDQLPYEEPDEARQKEAAESMKQNIVDSVKSDCHKALDVVYGAWNHGKYPRDVAPFNVKGTRGLITADMSWGASWDALEQFTLLNILEITCDLEE